MMPTHENLGTIFYWNTSPYCNYTCEYCCAIVELPQGNALKVTGQTGPDVHMFSVAEPDAWVRRFQEIEPGKKSFWITGGEPFLDFARFITLLSGLKALPDLDHIRIDTNGFWNADQIGSLDPANIHLNVAFHPSQTTFDPWLARVIKMRDRGFPIVMINYVMAPEQSDDYDNFRRRLAPYDFFVNPSVFIPPADESHAMSEAERAFYMEYLPDIDIAYRSGSTSPQGKPCHHPTHTYYIRGSQIAVNCTGGPWKEFFDETPGLLPTGPVPCPMAKCVCIGMYSMLDDFPADRMITPNILGNYAAEVMHHAPS